MTAPVEETQGKPAKASGLRTLATILAIGTAWSLGATEFGLTWQMVGPYLIEPGRHLVDLWLPQPLAARGAYSSFTVFMSLAIVYGAVARLVAGGFIQGMDRGDLAKFRARHILQGLIVGWASGVAGQVACGAWVAIGILDDGTYGKNWLTFSGVVGACAFFAVEPILRRMVDRWDHLDLRHRESTEASR